MNANIDTLMHVAEDASLPPADALAALAELVNQSGDAGRLDGIEAALRWADRIRDASPSDRDRSLAHYFTANAHAIRRQLDSSTGPASEWSNPDLSEEIRHLRLAFQSPGWADLHPYQQCQILTNLGNALSRCGRLVEALEWYDRVLVLDSVFGMAIANRGLVLVSYTDLVHEPSRRNAVVRATKADLASVPVPDPTASYHPVPYGRFIEEVELHVPRFGLTVQSSAFALAREGNQMFGVLTCVNGKPAADYALAIGVRNSYDRSLSVGLVAGTRTFVCDNLAFSGEVTMHRKHTAHVFRDLPDLIYRMLSQVSSMRERIDGEIAAMKVRELPPAHAHHLMVEAVKANVLSASRLPKVIEAWEEPRHDVFAPRTAWSLFNAFTEMQRQSGPRAQMEGSLRLSSLFRRELQLN